MKLNQIKPTDDELRVILEIGFALRIVKRLDEAAEVFQGVAQLLPEADVPRVALATIDIDRGRFVEAQTACEEALRFNPESLYARVHRAEALLLQRRRVEAEAELNAVISADPQSAHSRTARALLKAAELMFSEGELEASASFGRS
jgi:predicted Zn-dependent protease